MLSSTGHGQDYRTWQSLSKFRYFKIQGKMSNETVCTLPVSSDQQIEDEQDVLIGTVSIQESLV